MIKANELRIGNWIHSITHKLNVRVNLIDTDLDYSVYSPIPLTEEWLIKFGFRKKIDFEQSDRDWGKESNINPRRALGIYKTDKFKEHFITFREDVGCGWVELNEINYVHQLQNLYFSLIGEELILKEL